MISGFDLAAVNGPLMDEPMQGAVFIVENVALDEQQLEKVRGQAKVKIGDLQGEDGGEEQLEKMMLEILQNSGPFAGQVMSTIKSLCKKAFLNSDPRIVEGMYLCRMQASPETYGTVYNVINKARGKVIKEDVQAGTNYFLIDALIPLSEGGVFNEQLRDRSCGIAQPQLVFHGYEVNADVDPLYIPKTIEELEEHGEGDAMIDNIAKVIIEQVRKQKGMLVSKMIQVDAEKQRTLTKAK